MSERTYFSFRYALPGFVFLVMLLVINIDNFIVQLNKYTDAIALFGIILGFITLLSGSAIGFIVSQIWYSFYNFIKTRIDRKSHKKLNDIIDNFDKRDRITIMAYFLTSKIDIQITAYINRLNDMIHSLGSTFFAIFLGLLLGYKIRLVTNQILFGKDYDCLIMAVSISFSLIIGYNLWTVFKEHDSIARLMLNLNGNILARDMRRVYSRSKSNEN